MQIAKEVQALAACNLCRRSCGVNRLKGEVGFCGANNIVYIARAALHHWEEPCISNTGGSGAVFFSHCSLKCVYCQNHEISYGGKGVQVTCEELADIFCNLQSKGADNINLVTPTHYIPQIVCALKLAKQKGLAIPVVYNTGGYETREAMELLAGMVDVYMPDLKYCKEGPAIKYSAAPGYFEAVCKTIEIMYAQVGPATFDSKGVMQKGVLVRHLMLPGLLFDTKKIIDYLHSTYGNNIFISLMCQYCPPSGVALPKELSKTLPYRQYSTMVEYAEALGVENCFIQGEGAASEEYRPAFDFTGLQCMG